MDQLLIILVALAVAALGWGASLLIPGVTEARKKRLSQRLSNDGPSHDLDHGNRALLLRSQNTGLPAYFDNNPTVASWQRWLNQGSPDTKLSKFLLIQAGLSVVLSVLGAAMTHNWLVVLLLGGAGVYAPYFVISSRRAKRRRLFNAQLPEALDFLSRVLRSGQSMSTGLQMMSDELPQPLAGEFRKCYDQHSLGQSLEDGLRDMAARVDSTDFAFFVTAVVIQRQSGGDLGEVLSNISTMVRKRLRLAQGVKSKTAEGRFTGYIMVAFPAVMFGIIYMINPEYGNVLMHTSLGHKFLLAAFGLQMFGLFLIKRITTVRV
jgi:tight adherence protein B